MVLADTGTIHYHILLSQRILEERSGKIWREVRLPPGPTNRRIYCTLSSLPDPSVLGAEVVRELATGASAARGDLGDQCHGDGGDSGQYRQEETKWTQYQEEREAAQCEAGGGGKTLYQTVEG